MALTSTELDFKKNQKRLDTSTMALEALRNVIKNNPGTPMGTCQNNLLCYKSKLKWSVVINGDLILKACRFFTSCILRSDSVAKYSTKMGCTCVRTVQFILCCLTNYSPLLAMQLNMNPEITFKQHKSQLRARKCLSSIQTLSYKQQR